MEQTKIGALIRQLRREQGLTQKQLAERLTLSPKTISKWENGRGAPDLSLIADLSAALRVDLIELLSGALSQNQLVGGNMKRTRYFVCPTCHSISLSTGNASVSCCGRPLAALEARKAEPEQKLHLEAVEDEWFITAEHPMTRENYISFLAMATGDRIELLKQYPEWDLNVRISRRRHGTLLWYSTTQGLLYQYV